MQFMNWIPPQRASDAIVSGGVESTQTTAVLRAIQETNVMIPLNASRVLRVLLGNSLMICLVAPCLACAAEPVAEEVADTSRILFTSAGRSGVVGADGTGLQWLEFDVANQATWQVADFFSDGQLLLLSMEPRLDGPGRSFEEYYTQTPTHLWRYSLRTSQLEELATVERRAPFYTPALLLDDSSMLVQVVQDRVGQIYRMNLDGSDATEFTRAGEGLPYGLHLSPNGDRVAFHLASPQGYQIWTSDLRGEDRLLIAAAAEHLYFGPKWSPDGQWIAYHDCHYLSDPGHDWSDLCLAKADGSEPRQLTQGQTLWFAATYGPPEAKGGGSNLPAWTPEGKLLYARRMKNSKVPWEYQAERPDTDHFNRDFKPALARGGTYIEEFDPRTGQTTPLTPPVAGRWDFRVAVSPDGQQIAFCRATTGQVPTLWVMASDGSNPREIASAGAQAVDHPRWIPDKNQP